MSLIMSYPFVADAWNVTESGDPTAPAVRVWSPIAGPSVQEVWARPFASVVAVATETLPEAAVNCTTEPDTGLPPASTSSTITGFGNGFDAAALWLSPET